MDSNILNVEQAVEFLGVSEKTLIKLLREEHIPARKIGREWRFSKEALLKWLSTGDSYDYINKNELYQVSEDKMGKTEDLYSQICEHIAALRITNDLNQLLNLDKCISIPKDAGLRVSYKQQRDVEKLEFKIFWPIREDSKVSQNQSKNPL